MWRFFKLAKITESLLEVCIDKNLVQIYNNLALVYPIPKAEKLPLIYEQCESFEDALELINAYFASRNITINAD